MGPAVLSELVVRSDMSMDWANCATPTGCLYWCRVTRSAYTGVGRLELRQDPAPLPGGDGSCGPDRHHRSHL